ncbi:MAG TPA: hypothetical protein VIK06_01700 [Candidatus Limnocylindrales bacterium]
MTLLANQAAASYRPHSGSMWRALVLDPGSLGPGGSLADGGGYPEWS